MASRWTCTNKPSSISFPIFTFQEFAALGSLKPFPFSCHVSTDALFFVKMLYKPQVLITPLSYPSLSFTNYKHTARINKLCFSFVKKKKKECKMKMITVLGSTVAIKHHWDLRKYYTTQYGGEIPLKMGSGHFPRCTFTQCCPERCPGYPVSPAPPS